MSFGKRYHDYERVLTGPRIQAEVQQPPKSDGVSVFEIVAFVAVGVLIALLVFKILNPPLFTYPSSRVHFRANDIARELGAIHGYERRSASKYTIDFSPILTPSRLETTHAMKAVARKCLPRVAYRRKVSPGQANVAYLNATGYLVCALKFKKQRLCDPQERVRLAGQLSHYLHIRENIFGIDRARKKITPALIEEVRMRDANKQYLVSLSERVNNPITTDVSALLAMPGHSKQLDPRIEDGIEALVKAGYLSASDFGFFGLILPNAYAHALVSPRLSSPSCH